MPSTLRLFAPAKINLFLHVIRRRADGYHELESLIVFADIGDTLTATTAPDLSLRLDGPFAHLLAGDEIEENLVYRAAALLRSKDGSVGADLRLEKQLPVAGGIGGGSADAAAALRVLHHLWQLDLPQADLHEIGLKLGADIPVCLQSSPAYVTGIGEHLAPVPPLPEVWAVLVNSGEPVPTGPVFQSLDPKRMPGQLGPFLQDADYADVERFVKALKRTRNDLESPARKLAPTIDTVLTAISATQNCLLARMSGSGGTCFGLFAKQDDAEMAAQAILRGHPDWWAQAGRLLQDAPELSQ